MIKRSVLYAESGNYITNGKIYGKQIFLGKDDLIKDFYEISEEEYNELMQKNEEVTQ